ncbi:MAG TPA: MoxR family ATPase [Chitinophagales bacterium]|jgi:MoxR-like ATPase|nr:MoxR family ATPase [Chitinophagales bacterium]
MEDNTIQYALSPEQQRLIEGVQSVRTELAKVIIGQNQMIDLLIAGLLTGGHVLIEGVPGIAKTLTARMLAKSVQADFSRIQFTPDLMPTDVLGTSVFNQKTAEFNFRKGPIFSNIILIDEVNRSPAKTQAALLEVMEELKVTMDGETYPMGFPFFVIATQNPIEQEGTYKLPEAQLDRFMFRIRITYPGLEDEKLILARYQQDFSIRQKEEVKGVISVSDLTMFRQVVENIIIKEELLNYIAEIVFKTRNHGDLFLGASPRASLNIMKSSKAIAAMRGRNFVTPDDIHFVTYAVLNHRIILTPDKELEGYDSQSVIKSIIESIDVPR